jgi:hypothetical protein
MGQEGFVMADVQVKVIYDSAKVICFIDAALPQEAQDTCAQQHNGFLSANALTIDAENPPMVWQIGVTDGVATVLAGDALAEAAAAAEAEAELNDLRRRRNQLLAETDWWANADLTMTAEQTAYRQALRDITNTYSSLSEAVWPTKP